MKGCLIAIAILLALVAGGGLVIWYNKDAITTELKNVAEGLPELLDLPDYGKQEYIDQEYGDLLRVIDAAAENASSIMTFGAAVEGITLPEEVLYVGINEGEDITDVIKQFEWSGYSKTIMSGYGAGSLSTVGVSKDIMIYKNEGPWNYMDNFIVYIEYSVGTEERLPNKLN